ncbi:MAG TPA: hypothetical protein VFK47_00475, partial [Ktedonobacteraceae bacterium]|nr:hypothetical protein [Ktedonobacteraceae bacterium]
PWVARMIGIPIATLRLSRTTPRLVCGLQRSIFLQVVISTKQLLMETGAPATEKEAALITAIYTCHSKL